jgi:hypothetical protein
MLDISAMLVITIWGTTVATRSPIFAWPRSKLERWPILAYFSECPLCVGTWLGFVGGLVWGHNPLVSAAATSLLAYAGNTVMDIMGGLSQWLATAEKVPPRAGEVERR